MKTTYTKEQAEQVFLDFQRFIGFDSIAETEIKFLNHKFPSLEVGKWYMHLDNLLFYVREIKEKNCYGYGFWDGEWFDDCKSIHDNNDCMQDIRLATKKEVEEALIAEAKRRGYNNGVDFNCCTYSVKVKVSERIYFHIYENGDTHLYSNGFIFNNGKWAEIINDPTKDKIAELEARINKGQKELQELKGLVD